MHKTSHSRALMAAALCAFASQAAHAQWTMPPLLVQVFAMPRDADSFDATRTVDVPGRIGGKATSPR